MDSSGLLPSLRSASMAKSIIRMAFFFTMPISRMMPIKAMMLSSVLKDQQRQQRAHAGRGKRGKNGDRVDVVLVENSQHDVDGDQRGQDQIGLGGERVLKGLRRALKTGMNRGRQRPSCAPLFEPRRTASPRVTFGARLKENVTAGNWPLMGDGQRRLRGLVMREGAERNVLAGRWNGRRYS